MSVSLAEDAIALLIDMAEQGEIDPWDVNVIEVIDRFLNQLPPVVSGQEPYEKSLSSSGQAFLYASMLVLLKADNLIQADSPINQESSPEEDVLLEDVSGGLPPHLERQIRRRAVAQPPQRRRVTLTDLIEQLRTIAQALEDPSPRKRFQRPAVQSRSQAVRAIAQLAHQENLSEMASTLEQFFDEHAATLASQDWLDFELLLDLWAQAQPAVKQQSDEAHPPKRDRVGIFWALLLLSAQSKVELSQEEFYQDLKVRPLTFNADILPTDGLA
ncbi:MAG: segregation/condensation protein A [Leptolyngbya sp.]|nr:MAG: segregation/condensation protein A [Leptolyngbya sp.]